MTGCAAVVNRRCAGTSTHHNAGLYWCKPSMSRRAPNTKCTTQSPHVQHPGDLILPFFTDAYLRNTFRAMKMLCLFSKVFSLVEWGPVLISSALQGWSQGLGLISLK